MAPKSNNECHLIFKLMKYFLFLGWDVILKGIRTNQYYLVWNNTNGSPGDILQKDLIITYQPR